MKAKRNNEKTETRGRKKVHTNPALKPCLIKLWATDKEWKEFLDLLPSNGREKFELLFKFVQSADVGPY